MHVRFSHVEGWFVVQSIITAAVPVMLSATLTTSPASAHFRGAIDTSVTKMVLIAGCVEQADDGGAAPIKRQAATSDWCGPGNGWG